MSGKLNSINLAASTPVVLWTNLTTTPSTITLSLCNKSTSTANVRVAIIDGASISDITDADYIEYDLALASRNVLERTAIVLGQNQSIYVFSSSAQVSAVVWGFTG